MGKNIKLRVKARMALIKNMAKQHSISGVQVDLALSHTTN